MNNKVVTIDGPAASGKSSVSRGVAEKLSWPWVSTGAFYRGLAFVAQKRQVSLGAEEELAALCRDPSWEIRLSLPKTQVFFNGDDVTDEVYREGTGSAASQISLFPKVRENLLAAQRECAAKNEGLIAEAETVEQLFFPSFRQILSHRRKQKPGTPKGQGRRWGCGNNPTSAAPKRHPGRQTSQCPHEDSRGGPYCGYQCHESGTGHRACPLPHPPLSGVGGV